MMPRKKMRFTAGLIKWQRSFQMEKLLPIISTLSFCGASAAITLQAAQTAASDINIFRITFVLSDQKATAAVIS